ncbi:hypothetical protein DCC39_10260 [Pueribacillus theae]|uniref:Uncharacterized protein n=1 Tax=Pueribacillus theae TaxID=2171751 RepID=A0A2U1K0Z1_9BACI|nr:hypothetical protein [Pueribacillus theae]PWA11072.1 hypothetical protein DCC39_10260 [Pueribacillus theae]
MPFSVYAKKETLNHLFRSGSLYLALYNGDPRNGGSEVSASEYERQSISFGEPVESSGSVKAQNNGSVEFPIASSDWGTVDYLAIYDAKTSGNLLDSDQLNDSFEVKANTQFFLDEQNYTIILNDGQ